MTSNPLNAVPATVLETLAERLNMLTVAEGVETPEQAAWLREHGVNYLQGYWIGRPMPLEQFRTWQPDITLGE